MASLNCHVPDEVKRKVDILAAETNEDIKDIVSRALIQFFKRKEKKGQGHIKAVVS